MDDLLVTLGSLIASLGNTQSASALREHNALLKAKLEFIRDRVLELEAEPAKLRSENIELEEYRAQHSKAVEFHEVAGACFRHLPNGGGFEKIPRCPKCHSVLSSVMPNVNKVPYECSSQSCGYKIYFENGMASVIAQLPNT